MRTFRLFALATVAALTVSAPALAQQQRSSSGTDANGPITIFKNMQAEPDGCRVSIDGREIDHLKAATYDDITTNVKAGRNTLTVTWGAGTTQLNFKVAFAPTRNNFKNVLVVNQSVTGTGSKTFTFSIPG